MWENESSGYSFAEVATYSNGVYERTVYTDNFDDIIKNGQNSYGESLENSVLAYYKIEGCEADFDSKNKILKSLTIKPNAKIIVDERRGFAFHGKYNVPSPLSFKGTINTDMTVKWEGKVDAFDSPKVFEINNSYNYYYPSTNGKDITNDYKNYQQGIQSSKKIESTSTYTFSKLEMNLSEFHLVDNPYWNESKEFKGNLKINIDGIRGSVIANKTIFVDCRTIQSNGNGWIWDNEKSPYYSADAYDYDDETGEEVLIDSSKPYYGYWNSVNVISNKSLTYGSPVTITLSGDISELTPTYFDYMTGQEIKGGAVKNSGNIKDLTLKINKMSGDFDSLVIDNAEVFVEVGDYKTEKVLMIGNQEVTFNKAKVNVTGLKYDYRWKPTSEKYTLVGNTPGYMYMEKSDEYKKDVEAMHRNCFGNAKVHLEAEETKNSVTIKADCDISKKTATLNLVNNGNLIVEDNNNGNILAFNFKTVDINATNVDVLANNKCEGAKLQVTGIEKDGTKSERTYTVVNGKLVLDTKSQKDKQAPANLPKVEISPLPEGLEDNSNSIEVAVSEAKEDLEKPEAKKPTKANDPNETLKVVEKNGKKVGHYEKKAAGNSKKIDSNITAKDKIICSVTFYGDKEYTLVFIIDYTNSASPQIKGSIFKGERNNVTMDTVENRIAQFAGKNGKITVITSEGSSEVAVQ